MSQILESLRMRVENDNESSHKKIDIWEWEWDESFPCESQFRDRYESLAEVCQSHADYRVVRVRRWEDNELGYISHLDVMPWHCTSI